MNTVAISLENFKQLISNYSGEVQLHLYTSVRMKKTGNKYFGTVKKITRGVFTVGVDYSEQVNEAAGVFDFKAKPLTWGHWIPGYEGYLIEHNGKVYLRYYGSSEDAEQFYTVNNLPATPAQYAEFSQFITKSKCPHTQEAVCLDKDTYIRARTVCLENLFSIKFNNTEYTVIM